MMRSFVVLTFLCLALLGCGDNRAPQTFTIREGETVTYEAGVARVGDKVVCEVNGGHIGAEVQKPGMGVGGAGLGGVGEEGASIDVDTREDGSVVASCDG
jgi:hypothetical protein